MVIVLSDAIVEPLFASFEVKAFNFARLAVTIIVVVVRQGGRRLTDHLFLICKLHIYSKRAFKLVNAIVVDGAFDAGACLKSRPHCVVNGTSNTLAKLHEQYGCAG